MSTKTELTAIGLMSGTSLDGIDAAVITTDGERVTSLGPVHFQPYGRDQHDALRALLDKAADQGRDIALAPETCAIERDLTLAQASAVQSLMQREGISPEDIDIVGFHGQTILHRPEEKWTWQMGDGALLANTLGLPVINDFRSADVEAGGEGAPFAPLYHRSLLQSAGLGENAWPLAVLNIGGVANVTWIGAGDDVLAFDTGPGNALIDDWVRGHTGQSFDTDGIIAGSGSVAQDRVEQALQNAYFDRIPPKSLDRLDFTGALAERLSLEDGAATLTAFTVASIGRSRDHMSVRPKAWYVCGGGRKNNFLIKQLQEELEVPVEPVEVLGWRGNSLEAEAFGFLAVRSLRGLPLSVPNTTGVPAPITGGRLHQPG